VLTNSGHFGNELLESTVLQRLAVDVRDAPAVADPLLSCTDRWLLASQLQKAIRRGRSADAVRAAHTIWCVDSAYVWRRLRIIALEDVGVGDLEAVACCLAIAGKRAAQRAMGETKVLAHIVHRLAHACKSRLACDLVCLADHHIGYMKSGLLGAGDGVWKERALDDTEPVERRAQALRLLGGMSQQTRFGFRSLTKPNAQIVQEIAAAWDVPPVVRYIAAKGSGTCGLHALLLLAFLMARSGHFGVETTQECGDSTSEGDIGGVMACSYCMYTRCGRRAIKYLLRRDPSLNRLLASCGATDPAKAFGYLVFQTEGSALSRRLDFPAAAALGDIVEAAELETLGIRHGGIALRSRVVEWMPALHSARRYVATMAIAQGDLLTPRGSGRDGVY
jgi:hypothetical protein